MGERKRTADPERSAGQASGEAPPPRRFANEMAFDSRFEARRWSEVEPELRAEYPVWLERNQIGAAAGGAWDGVRHEVREAWEAALAVEYAEVDELTGQWHERAAEYRQTWERRYGPTGGRWEEVEPGWRYADAMAGDPRYAGRPWDDVAHGLTTGFPAWAASHGYRITEGEGWWGRLRDSIRHAWDHLQHRRPG